MKYGLLWFKKTRNIGDDIQSYAQSLFLPKIDYFVEREDISDFKSKNNEPVAVIMNAWWLWKKWNWPPSKCIIPKLTSVHFTPWTTENWGSSIKNEILQGVGKDFFNSYGPVGARDLKTLKTFRENKIKSYFSGCLTLTLPKMKKIEVEEEYVCAVDLDEDSLKKLREIAGDKIKIKVITHDLTDSNELLTWEERKKNVEDLLTLYQNSKCVLTSRLHASLPCLALEVPVLLIRNDYDKERFEPYFDYLNHMTPDEFCNSGYDIFNPKQNKKDYLKLRNALIKDVNSFITQTKSMGNDLSKLIKTKYTDKEVKDWQYDLMKDALDKWFYKSRDALKEYNKTISYLRRVEKTVYDLENSTSWKITKPLRTVKKKITRKKQ